MAGPKLGPRSGHALVYDGARRKAVMFGGVYGSTWLNDTWEWGGSAWVDVTLLGPRPSARALPAMAYDGVHRRAVLFGGQNNSGKLGDTWEWDGLTKTWTAAAPASKPSARGGHAMVFDAARGTVVLFGGVDANNQFLADTWEWDGATKTWTDVTPSGVSPTGREFHAMAYDAARGKVMLFGGHGADYVDLADTWEWDGLARTWTPVTVAVSPSLRTSPAMAYDAVRHKVVLFGGHGGGYLNDTWEWDGAAKTWTQLTPAAPPAARGGHAMTYDAARGKVVLMGGFSSAPGTGSFDDTWEWDGSSWTNVSPGPSPPARSSHAVAYDVARERVLLFGGFVSGVALADTWEWDGAAWTQASPASSPPARGHLALADDLARQRVVLFGGFGGSGWLADTWEWNGATWANVTPASSPPRAALPRARL
ncbi:MAG: hypothetical protein OZ921_06535 [Sorangiineae bacterium]|nr:hypothetical protein [Sorangiineae bacterium]